MAAVWHKKNAPPPTPGPLALICLCIKTYHLEHACICWLIDRVFLAMSLFGFTQTKKDDGDAEDRQHKCRMNLQILLQLRSNSWVTGIIYPTACCHPVCRDSSVFLDTCKSTYLGRQWGLKWQGSLLQKSCRTSEKGYPIWLWLEIGNGTYAMYFGWNRG